jgi:hypothetical protein
MQLNFNMMGPMGGVVTATRTAVQVGWGLVKRWLAKLGAARGAQSWKFGAFKSAAKWEGQLAKRGWTPQQITEAIAKGERFAAENLVNKGNAATRFVHTTTGRSVVQDQVTKEIIHVGGSGFKY